MNPHYIYIVQDPMAETQHPGQIARKTRIQRPKDNQSTALLNIAQEHFCRFVLEVWLEWFGVANAIGDRKEQK